MKSTSSDTLTGIVNIGPDTRSKLISVGIDSYEKLKAVGTENAFLQLQSLDPGACLCLLYGLDGAVQGIKSSLLSADRKKELQFFYKMAKKQLIESK